MSSGSTSTPSVGQTYCCFSREPQVLCRRLKEMALPAWVAEKSFTGIATSPNDTVRDPMERAAAITSPDLTRRPTSGLLLTLEAKSFHKTLFSLEYIMPPVAAFFQPRRNAVDREVHRLRGLELLPCQGHRNRCARHSARGIRDVEGLAAHVHVVIDEDLAGAFLDGPIERDVLRMRTHQVPSHGLADVARLIEGHGALDGHEHVQTRLSRGLHHRCERHFLEELPQPERNAFSDREAALVELGLGARSLLAGVHVGIDVEDEVLGVVEDRGLERCE